MESLGERLRSLDDTDGGGTRAELRVLGEKFNMMEARIASTPVTLGGRLFLSLPDVAAYVVANIPSNLYYLFHDCVSLLERINPSNTGRADVMMEMYQASKQGLAGEAEAQMVASFCITLPAVFCRNQKDDTPGTARHLPALKTYLAWNAHDNSSGAKQYIERGLNDLRISLKYDITTSLYRDMLRPRTSRLICS